ncbi:hypothetical protein DFQ27_001484 [Actinomortierella ambigua]|uniref:Uncharacterized protein n=1 Tax=Actinomortierella ambigua TaxID=1343610 RepID=A0A9P6UBX4_9FUNG|nr:hypothetical protein DFQ26_008252 [Actinomortierella ambigua]KAG0269935.1 hypothetical protein DFQ27_001484 [Actinomortierella ambigua]
MFLRKRYSAVLEEKKRTLPVAVQGEVEVRIEHILKSIAGNHKVIDRTIFNTFKGSCAKAGKRPPTELCGSAKSIACHAPWGIDDSLFDKVHKNVGEVIRSNFEGTSALIQDTMVNQVLSYCPEHCSSWVEPFQNIMLVWEQREHYKSYRVTPNCLPLHKGGI